MLKDGYPAVVLPVEQRLRCYEALDPAHTRDDDGPSLALVAGCLEASFAVYWRALGLTEP